MNKKLLAVVAICASLLYMSMPIASVSAHSTAPVQRQITLAFHMPSTTCVWDSCDGQYPAGTGCAQGDTLLQDVYVTDHNGVGLGDLQAYTSQPSCRTYWVTFRYSSRITIDHDITITSSERPGDDTNDWATVRTVNIFQGQYYDAQMQTHDTANDGFPATPECFIGGLDFKDNYDVQRHFNVATWCTSY